MFQRLTLMQFYIIYIYFNFKSLHSLFHILALFGIHWHAFSQSECRNYCMRICETIYTWYSILYADKTFQRNMPGKWLSKEHTCLLITSPHTSVLPFHNTVKKTQWSLCWTPVNRWRKNINQEHLRVQQFNQSIINNLYSYTIRNSQRNAGGVVSSI